MAENDIVAKIQLNAEGNAAQKVNEAAASLENLKSKAAATASAVKGIDFTALGEQLGKVRSVEQGMQALQESMLGAGGAVAATAALAVVAVGVGAAMVTMGITASETAEHLSTLAARTGLSTQQVQLLAAASRNMGASINDLLPGIGTLQRRLAENDQRLASVGVTSHDTMTALGQISDAMTRIKDPSERAALAIRAMGISGDRALPLLRAMGPAINDAREALDKAGGALSDQSIQAGTELAAQVHNLDNEWRTFADNFRSVFVPVAAVVLDALNVIIDKVIQAGNAVAQLGAPFRAVLNAINQIQRSGAIGKGEGLAGSADTFVGPQAPDMHYDAKPEKAKEDKAKEERLKLIGEAFGLARVEAERYDAALQSLGADKKIGAIRTEAEKLAGIVFIPEAELRARANALSDLASSMGVTASEAQSIAESLGTVLGIDPNSSSGLKAVAEFEAKLKELHDAGVDGTFDVALGLRIADATASVEKMHRQILDAVKNNPELATIPFVATLQAKEQQGRVDALNQRSVSNADKAREKAMKDARDVQAQWQNSASGILGHWMDMETQVLSGLGMLNDGLQTLQDGLGLGLSTVFANLTNSAQTFGSAMQTIWKSVVDSILQQLARLVTAAVFRIFVAFLAQMFGGPALLTLFLPGTNGPNPVQVPTGNLTAGPRTSSQQGATQATTVNIAVSAWDTKSALDQIAGRTGSLRSASMTLRQVGTY